MYDAVFVDVRCADSSSAGAAANDVKLHLRSPI